jgi:hypothetical protein
MGVIFEERDSLARYFRGGLPLRKDILSGVVWS